MMLLLRLLLLSALTFTSAGPFASAAAATRSQPLAVEHCTTASMVGLQVPVPPQPVDPCEAASAALAQLDDEIADIEDELGLLDWVIGHVSANCSSGDQSACDELRALEEDKAALLAEKADKEAARLLVLAFIAANCNP